MKISTLLLIGFLIGTFQPLFATTWTSTGAGNWTESALWTSNNGATGGPGYSFADTVIIHHGVVASDDIILQPNAKILIESPGSLCSHHEIFLKPGSKLHVSGKISCKRIEVDGGIVWIFNGGQAYIKTQVYLSGTGASCIVDSMGMMVVGVEFDCPLAEGGYLFSEAGKIPGDSEPTDYTIFDLTGRMIYHEEKADGSRLSSYPFPSGIYIEKCLLGDGTTRLRKIFVSR